MGLFEGLNKMKRYYNDEKEKVNQAKAKFQEEKHESRAWKMEQLRQERADVQERLSLAKAKNEVRELKKETRREQFKPLLSGLSNIQGRLAKAKAKNSEKGKGRYYNKEYGEPANKSPFSNPSMGPGPQGVYNIGRETGNPWRENNNRPSIGHTAKAKKKKERGIFIRFE